MRLANCAALVALVAPVALLAQDAATQPSKPREFDVVSIKPSDGNGPLLSVKDARGRITMQHVTVHSFLFRAFPITADTPIVGLPKWAESAYYDLEATVAENAKTEERRQMWQTLLADRLKLVAHMETREQPVFHLVRAKSDQLGPNLTPSTLTCPQGGSAPIPDILQLVRNLRGGGPGPAPTAMPPEMLTRFLDNCGTSRQGGIASGSMSMEGFAAQLGDFAGRAVIDRTGLEGTYRIHLNLAPPPGATAEFAPSLFSALPEQLGLKLEPAKDQRPALVIDRIERPSEN